jgi:uncharacterized membrane protein
MMSGVEYALGAMLFFGIGDLIYKRGGLAGVQPHHLLMVQSWVFLPTVTVFGWLSGTLAFVSGTLWGCAAGLFIWLGFYNFAHSLGSGSISVNAPIFRLSFVMTAVLAIVFLGESLTWAKALGILLALIATWLLLAVPGASAAGKREETLPSLVRVAIATVAVGIGNLIYKLGLRAGATPASLVVAQACVVVPISTLFVALIDRRPRLSVAVLRYAPAAAIVLAVAFALMVGSLTQGEASSLIPIAQMGFVVTALFGFLFMREAFTARKGAGLLAALGALASFAFG